MSCRDRLRLPGRRDAERIDQILQLQQHGTQDNTDDKPFSAALREFARHTAAIGASSEQMAWVAVPPDDSPRA